MAIFKETNKVQTKSYYLFLTISTAHEQTKEMSAPHTIETQNEIIAIFYRNFFFFFWIFEWLEENE